MDSAPQWELTTEIPTWGLANAVDCINERYLTLTVPTVLDELTRQIRIQVDTESFESIL
jgi:hypothetical protein